MSDVAANLAAMVGVWHDRLVAYAPDGTEVTDDPHGGVPGPFPYDNLVYVDFDGHRYTQTNVTFRGRPVHARTFRGVIDGGVLRFDSLGPDDPGHIGVAAGPGTLVYVAERNDDDAVMRYDEPDFIKLSGDQRVRTTVLYRHGVVVRTMTASGTRLTTHTTRRIDWDPRGADGSVHEAPSSTQVYRAGGSGDNR